MTDIKVPIGDDLNTGTMTSAQVKLHPEQKGWASRVIAGHAKTDKAAVVELLDCCGITAEQGKAWGLQGKPVLLVPRSRR